MQATLDRLTAWGCDVTGALARFLGDQDLYLDCLKLFDEDQCFTDLPLALEKEDYSAAFDQAHTLKGVAANLGLTPLYDAICALVEELRAKKYSRKEELYQKIVEQHAYFSSLLQ